MIFLGVASMVRVRVQDYIHEFILTPTCKPTNVPTDTVLTSRRPLLP